MKKNSYGLGANISAIAPSSKEPVGKLNKKKSKKAMFNEAFLKRKK